MDLEDTDPHRVSSAERALALLGITVATTDAPPPFEALLSLDAGMLFIADRLTTDHRARIAAAAIHRALDRLAA